MHAARLDRSPRLQRVHALLSDGVERSTLDIAELRKNGAWIECRQIVTPADGSRIFLYRMIVPCPQVEAA